MSYLTARIVVTAPASTWIDEVIACWEALAPRTRGTWQLESTRRGNLRFTESTTSPRAWPRLADELRRGSFAIFYVDVFDSAKQVRATLDVDLLRQLPGGFEPADLCARIYPGLPALVTSERHPRCITVSAAPEDHELLAHLVVAMYRSTEVCWAQIALEPRRAWTFEPQWRTWTEWHPYIRNAAAEAAWLVVLGPGQIAALGGVEAARRALADHAGLELTGPQGQAGLLVKTAPLPVASSDPRVASLRAALSPILLAPPIRPAHTFLVDARGVHWRDVPVPAGVTARALPSEFLAVTVGWPHPRPEGTQELADATQHAYGFLQRIGVPLGADRIGPSLSLWDECRSPAYMRLYPGIPVFHTGEREAGEAPLTLFVTGRARARLLAALTDVIAQHAGVTCELTDNALRCRLPPAFAAGDRRLELVLALDRSAISQRGARVQGAVLGDILSTDEVVRSFEAGSPRGFGPPPS